MFPLEKLAGAKRMVVEVEDMGHEEWRFEYQRGFVKGLVRQWAGWTRDCAQTMAWKFGRRRCLYIIGLYFSVTAGGF